MVVVVSVVLALIVAGAVPLWRQHQADVHREQVNVLLFEACLDLAETSVDTDTCLDKYAAR